MSCTTYRRHWQSLCYFICLTFLQQLPLGGLHHVAGYPYGLGGLPLNAAGLVNCGGLPNYGGLANCGGLPNYGGCLPNAGCQPCLDDGYDCEKVPGCGLGDLQLKKAMYLQSLKLAKCNKLEVLKSLKDCKFEKLKSCLGCGGCGGCGGDLYY